MNIQPNYINHNYNQPAFQAKFANDEETQGILKRFINSEEGPESIYCLMQNLDSMNSQDEIAIEKTNSDRYADSYTILNKQTGASVNMYAMDMILGLSYYDEHGQLNANNKPAKALYECMTKNLESLFEDTSLKSGAEFIKPSAKTLRNIDGMTWDYQKQCELKKNIGIINYKIRGLEKERKEMAQEKRTLDDKMQFQKATYVTNQLDMRA